MHSSHFIASTGLANEPNSIVNPPAPNGSRAMGDIYVHYIEDSCNDEALVRFWFPENVSGKVLPVDFEVLKPISSWLKNEPLILCPKVVATLISMVFFQELTQDFYKNKINVLSFKELMNPEVFEIDYPKVRISKYEIS